eukprot:scaffold978_cov392-Prasinococcus_capsulatus_cf.AAC.24
MRWVRLAGPSASPETRHSRDSDAPSPAPSGEANAFSLPACTVISIQPCGQRTLSYLQTRKNKEERCADDGEDTEQ